MIVCGLLWSTGGFIIKLIPWPPMAVAGIRSGLAAIIIILYDNPKKFYFSFTTWAGAICYSIMVLCFVSANKMTNDFIAYYRKNISGHSTIRKNVISLLDWCKEKSIICAVCTNKREDFNALVTANEIIHFYHEECLF